MSKAEAKRALANIPEDTKRIEELWNQVQEDGNAIPEVDKEFSELIADIFRKLLEQEISVFSILDALVEVIDDHEYYLFMDSLATRVMLEVARELEVRSRTPEELINDESERLTTAIQAEVRTSYEAFKILGNISDNEAGLTFLRVLRQTLAWIEADGFTVKPNQEESDSSGK